METIEQIASRILSAIPEAKVTVIGNAAVPGQASILLGHGCAVNVARFLRDDAALRLDYCSNVTGLDWLDRVVKTTTKTMQLVDGVEKEAAVTTEESLPGYLEAVYILYSMSLKHGPVILRLRTADRLAETRVPSLTPVWKSAEFQEREAYDLFGIHFDGHPDLRRILMWDEFTDYPMRKDYRQPDDYEYEPTPHDEIVAKAARHAATAAQPFPEA
ncbi:MAG TPA: NADH-quinone oxidoreductase subunit C [Chthoniobacteraceae bacterium]|jgi:NADH-quinone oxidoreductase subunit C|nr:NADH-quinone oxidoreductase subunit C [Chthoniobacteraceae bacterium]